MINLDQLNLFTTLIFLFISVPLFLNLRKNKLRSVFYMLLILMGLVIISAFKPINVMYDAETYVYFFDHINSYTDVYEPLFMLLWLLIRLFSEDYIVMFGCVALFSLSLKFYFSYRYSTNIWLSVAVIVTFLFPLQDLVQIRAASASGVLLFSIPALCNRNVKSFLGYVLIASLFHYSALCWLFLWFIRPDTINVKFWLFIFIFGYIVAVLNIFIADFISYIPVDIIRQKMLSYYERGALGDIGGVKIFGGRQLLQSLVGLFVLFCSHKLYRFPYAFLVIKIYMLSLFVFLVFSGNYVFAYRFSEMYQIVLVLLIPLLPYCFKRQTFGKFIAFSYCALYLFVFFFVIGLSVK